MRSPLDVVLGRVGGFPIRELTRRAVPCFKHVVEDGREVLAVCLLVDGRYLYRYPYSDGRPGPLGAIVRVADARVAAYLRGEMEHLRLREFQPGVCRYVNQKESAGSAS